MRTTKRFAFPLLVMILALAGGDLPLASAVPSGAAVANVVAQFVVTMTDLPLVEIPSCPEPGVVPGVLSMDTRPWTRLIIDGEPRGSTPLFRERLLPGMHEVSFSNEKSSISVTEQFVVEPGRATKVIGRFVAQQLSLTPVSTDDVVPEAIQADCADDLVDPAFLSINTEPWAQVFVDGKLFGTTPLFRAKVAPGIHRVQLVPEAPHVGTVIDVNVGAGETVKLRRWF